jgi:transcriptional regulator with XRE-family HTH domain
MRICDKIKLLREEKGWSQRQLGERTGISGSYISLIEKGKSKGSIDSLEAIARVLGVKLAELFDDGHVSRRETVSIGGQTFTDFNDEYSSTIEARTAAADYLSEMMFRLEMDDLKSLIQIVSKMRNLYEVKDVWGHMTSNAPEDKESRILPGEADFSEDDSK